MSRAQQPSGEPGAVKDPDGEYPIAVGWRPTLGAIAEQLAGRNYAVRGVPRVDSVSASLAESIAWNIAEYGETLTLLSEQTWNSSVARWMNGYWQVIVDLWTAESGRSDLALHLRVFEQDGGFRFIIEGVYVP